MFIKFTGGAKLSFYVLNNCYACFLVNCWFFFLEFTQKIGLVSFNNGYTFFPSIFKITVNLWSTSRGVGSMEYIQGVGYNPILPINLGDSHFPHFFFRCSHSMQNNTAFIMWHGKELSVILNLRIPYFKWSARLHSDDLEFSDFYTQYSSFQNLKRHHYKIQCKPMENLMNIQQLAKYVLPHGVQPNTFFLSSLWLMPLSSSRCIFADTI